MLLFFVVCMAMYIWVWPCMGVSATFCMRFGVHMSMCNCVCVCVYVQSDEVDGISTVKFAYIQWVGENVTPMAKAKVATQQGMLEGTFKVSSTDTVDLINHLFYLCC